MLRLLCAVQHYEWGRIGAASEVGRLHALASGEDVEDIPYAELWMGTHRSGPSRVVAEDKSEVLLKDWLDTHPEALGQNVIERWEGELPFLFKVLSVAKALSIQAHPDKKLGQYLHETQPHNYKDANHKPEMALALTPFEALCGFVTPEELKQAVETVPELRSVLGEATSEALIQLGQCKVSGDESKRKLKEAYTILMTLRNDVVSSTVSQLVIRLVEEKEVRQLTEKEELVLRLEKQYPADIGVLSIFFLNYLRLSPGEAVCLGANEPHAYLSGEIIECMAASDNVVRAGFTPKYRDTQTLCSMLTYKQGLPDMLTGTPVSACTTRYTPPFDEFEVDHIVVPVGESINFENLGPSIFIVFEGIGVVAQSDRQTVTSVKKGDVFFVSAGQNFEIAATVEVDEDVAPAVQAPLHLYRAGVNSCLYHTHHNAT
ncbi:mannose-6-phosphate isomerase 2 [Physcomitrium patens]|uniref:mannose-6-phosphate isomerase n=1 Tax=Physcomitrium patens TaxID=3218 RepID=A0A2K1KFL2_PHYPA|nr:mannose-6-phosphate isomerase 2-like [Physcomitrium patens]XP_024379037.1 mannose-6-phosphate isomerase 2-like [Physcomitrium patens]XP_024379039.1 mannose-6-phosphate isomerase 2-like [Physcomitrium patens]XP_024379040.1 mannose-6-phosphate isomerase 2-like [Physcomitrium patens]PNR52571.1 hypothetical protein PHYPA_008945 [Physcomitrium patens]|eukprot:XP_024379036.1 mannose-6-phosphate isomerase 2-like [Physcomitrella patens]